MVWMVASDIHGSAYYCKKMLERFREEKADKLLLLGDLLYHGPRNDLPREYAPKEVIALLNECKSKICCVRGNCDGEVDQMVLEFPIMADYCVLEYGKTMVYATHGHVFGEQNVPPFVENEILLCGHTHVPACVDHGDYLYLNPGSVSIPKAGSWHGYMLLLEDVIQWKDMEGNVKMEYRRGNE